MKAEIIAKLLIEEMELQDDVDRVIGLTQDQDGRWRYLIETPFAFPKFAIGTTDQAREDVRVEFSCGILESAEAEWTTLAGQEVSL